MTRFLLFFAILMMGFSAFAQPSIVWQRCYGGTNNDYFTDAQNTLDNGVITCITTGSVDGDLAGLDSAFGWVIKFDSLLEIEWQRLYGNPDLEIIPRYCKQLVDSNYIFYGFGGIGTNGFQGQLDFMLMKTDKFGNLLWHKSYGGPGLEAIDGFIATTDGGFLFTGQSAQAGGDIPFHYGDVFFDDANIIKTDNEGNIEWIKNLGGSGVDGCIGNPVEISPGKYQVHIYSGSDDYDLIDCGITAFQKRWVINLNNEGVIEQQVFYEAEENLLRSDGQTGVLSDNRTIIIGSGNAMSPLFPAPEGHQGEEGAVGIFNNDLLLTNVKMFGGSGAERFYKYCNDIYNDFYFLGYSLSQDYDLPGNYNLGEANDYWLVKTDGNFNKIWSINFGGSNSAGDLATTSWHGNLVFHNNNLLYFGSSVTPEELPDFDIACGNLLPSPSPVVKLDAWMVAFDLQTAIEDYFPHKNNIQLYPNPADKFTSVRIAGNESFEYQVFSSTGLLISEGNVNSINTQINTADLQNGIYYIRFIQSILPSKTSPLIIIH
ncbi:MAG TPA: T9SS type A sorting domain-containing protein [Chitinophagales bacterium]|nr:T9SS type A sorting domain-containing protein [Chitinophagales bacterium]HRG28764.1 T9SS type A sorting domain-containing protein [Chitinophagales bacterium]HRH52423.1 T9SS type A sorting domain-containing protein [Chitinophagales bacterium]